jgi:hypothetical protein
MNRISKAQLQAVCDRINTVAGTPLQPYAKVGDKYEPQARCYHLSGAYGGYCLEQMCDTGSGVRSVISGYRPKRELYDLMHAFLRGLEAK